MYSPEINFDSSRTRIGNDPAKPDTRKQQTTAKLQNTAERVQQRCSNSMAAHPLATVAAAIVIGVTLGWLVKRR